MSRYTERQWKKDPEWVLRDVANTLYVFALRDESLTADESLALQVVIDSLDDAADVILNEREAVAS